MRTHLSRHHRRGRERGSAMVIALIALTGLITLGSLTVLSVQGGLAAAGHDRSSSVALYAAESGAASAMDYLRKNLEASGGWDTLVEPANASPQIPSGIAGNQARPASPGNLFSTDMQAWFEVEILNNLDDTGYATGDDNDHQVIIRSTGHGPNDTVAIVEWQVKAGGVTGSRPCPGYGQKGMAEDGAGRNDCLGSIVSSDTATYTPGTP